MATNRVMAMMAIMIAMVVTSHAGTSVAMTTTDAVPIATEFPQTIHPVNTALLYGETLRLNCRLNNDYNTVDWAIWQEELEPLYQNTTVNRHDLARNCTIRHNVVDNASVETDETGSCDLVVSNIRSSANGKYACFNRQSLKNEYVEVMTIAIESVPKCTTDLVDGAVVDGQNVSIACHVTVHGPIRPKISWSVISNKNVSLENSTTTDINDEFTSKVQLTAYPPTFPEVAVKIFFGPPSASEVTPKLVMNAPTWTYEWSAPAAEIGYPSVEKKTFESSEIFVGDTVSCFDVINPRGVYVWQNVSNNGTVAEGPVARFNEPGEYSVRCLTSVLRNIIVKPKELRNVAVMNGTVNLTLFCDFKPDATLWKFRAVNATEDMDQIIADKCVVSDKKKYRVDTTHGGCSLVISEVLMKDGGMYICATRHITEKPAFSAQLIVLGGGLMCNSGNYTPTTCDPATAVMSCEMTYWGNVRYEPVMKWRDLVVSKAVNSTNVYTCNDTTCKLNSTVSYTTTKKTLELQCGTGFKTIQSAFKLVIGLNYTIVKATNIPDYNYTWTSPLLNSTASVVILIQQHYNATPFFNRSWSEMMDELGTPTPGSEYWAGLVRMNELTKSGHTKLRLDLQTVEGSWLWEEYSTFMIGDNSTNYVMTVAGYTGNDDVQPGYSMLYQNGLMFSTLDRQNDWSSKTSPCALLGGGWWYINCAWIELNAISSKRFFVQTGLNKYYKLKSSAMSLECN